MSIAPPRKIQWDRVVVSEAAAGNWGWIHQDLGIPIGDRRPGVPGPCPKKGGKDKFRLYDDYHETGGAVSNEDGSFANGFRLIVWWNNWDGPKGYSDAVNLVGDHLHSCGMLELPTNNGQSATPRKLAATTSGRGRGPNSNTNGKSLSRRPNAEKPPVNANKVAGTRKKLGMVPIDPANPLHREAAAMFAKAKPGITAETILSSGCEIGRWYDGTLVLSMPAYKSSDAGEPVHAEILYKVNGERFAAYGDLPERKVHLVMQKNSGDSWFIVGGTERLKLANFVVKVEGSTDALAMAGIVPDDWAVSASVDASPTQDKRDLDDGG
jgi:hypothetical protein